MGFTPWLVGDLSPVWTLQLLPDSGAFNVSGLVASDFTMLFLNEDSLPITEITGTGTFSTITAATVVNGVVTTPASVQYQVSSSDVATPGDYKVLVQVQTPNGPMTFRYGTWQLQSLADAT